MRNISLVLGLVALGALGTVGPVHALSMKECSAKYQEAKKAGGKLSWNDFRKAECGTEASAGAAAAPAATTPASPVAPPAASAATKPASGAAAGGAASYPSAVDPKYAKESPGKARMHTCLDAYNAAKAAGTLGGMKWIQKGGGYYSTCNSRLKG